MYKHVNYICIYTEKAGEKKYTPSYLIYICIYISKHKQTYVYIWITLIILISTRITMLIIWTREMIRTKSPIATTMTTTQIARLIVW